MNKTNSSKRLLAAIVAIAMIVCAIAVIMPADSVQAAVPNDGTSGVEATDIASEADLLELDANSDGIITIDTPTVYNITGEVGTADNPVDVKFELNSDLRITGVGSLYVQPTGPATDNIYTRQENKEKASAAAQQNDTGSSSFQVSAVSMGPMKFITLKNGERVFEGGELPGGYVLEKVSVDELTLTRNNTTTLYPLRGSSFQPLFLFLRF